ncbi:rhombosortase [Sphaerotilus mobilis]|uniref:Rhomboid family GlyGly-CTERM serine protease n=1 Tax=Sphaerotilus mobilis TaxID=47994 RepID=A0A4Q7LGN2_9BURK|nr:rhombosortase [Sphaerotilus mobilis]RZS53183.1 rhomboid family GlyGly-CTERM serine protease [Sphaerotilus mobilis]
MSWKLLLRPRRWSAGQVAWLVMLSVLVVPAVLSGPGDALAREVLAWRPDRAWDEPWRWWSAAWMHLNTAHLLANLSGAVLVAALGWLLQPDRRMAWAWALAWPLTHLSLLLQPGLTRYGGLSGVLHAGVAVCAVWLWSRGERRGERHLGQALAAGLLLKLLLERAWEAPLNRVAGLDIVVAPLAHAAGAFWGALLALLVIRLTQAARP